MHPTINEDVEARFFDLLLLLLVVQHDVWLPYPAGWYSDKLYTPKIFWIPSEFVIIPDLKNQRVIHLHKNKSEKLQCQTKLS